MTITINDYPDAVLLDEADDNTNTYVLDRRDPNGGGTRHHYAVTDKAGAILHEIRFQQGPGKIGLQHRHLLTIMGDRYDGLQSYKYASELGQKAAEAIDVALMYDTMRTRRRKLAAVEGIDAVAPGGA